MATEQVTVIEGDGSSDSVTVTDDPVEDATVQSVRQAIGDETTASEQADSTVAATLLERVTALVDVLTSGQADDEIRVALATDLLAGNLDVDIANQSSGNLAIELAADSLTGNLDVDLAAQTSGALDVSGETVPTEQQTPIQLESSSGANIDPATEQTVDAIKTAAQALDDALASNGTDEIRVTSPSPLDVSASEVDVDLNSQSLQSVSVDLASDSLANPIDVDLASASAEPLDVSGATVPTEQQSPVKIEDSGGAAIDPATEQKLENVRALLDKLDDALTSAGGDEVRTTIENGASPVAFPDTGRRTVSTAGSPEALVSAPAPVASGVEVKAMPGNGNTAYVWISGEGKSDSYPLAAGDEVFMPVDDASKVIVDVDTGGDTVAFVAA